MRKQMCRIFATLSLSIMLATTLTLIPVNARSARLVTVNIPFDFNVGGQSLRAGAYIVRTVTPMTLNIQSADYRQNAIVHAEISSVGQTPVPARLGFRRYGNQYFLAQVWTPWQECEISPSSAERRRNQDQEKNLAKKSALPEIVYVLAD